jgi:tetratricopeptide (TPR) repeat protein
MDVSQHSGVWFRLYFLAPLGVGIYKGFTEAQQKREKAQSGVSINKAITSMKPEAKALYDASQNLFKQMRESATDPNKVKQLNDENIATLKKALEIEPNNPQLWVNLGGAYTWISTTGTLQDGLKAYARAEELDPTNAIYIANTADMLWRLGKYDDAILEVQKAIRMDDNYAFAHFVLARSYSGNKLYENARTEYQKTIDVYKSINTTGQFDDDILQAQKEQAALPKN